MLSFPYPSLPTTNQRLAAAEMKTAPYSAGFHYAPRDTIYCPRTARPPSALPAYGAPESSSPLVGAPTRRPKSAPSLRPVLLRLGGGGQESPTVLGRREAAVRFGLRMGLSFLSAAALPPLQSENSEAACELTAVASGFAFCDKTVGTGPEAAKGQLIKAHYVGKLEDGKIFDSSYDRGKPLTFRVGVGEVIKGWDQGILGVEGVPPMLAGGKRTLRLPPELGYGARGAGCKGGSCIIPPNSVLVFDVEFIGKA